MTHLLHTAVTVVTQSKLAYMLTGFARMSTVNNQDAYPTVVR